MEEIDIENLNNIYISFEKHKELLNPNLKVKDVKKIIKEQTGIDEKNQQYDILFKFVYSSDENLF